MGRQSQERQTMFLPRPSQDDNEEYTVVPVIPYEGGDYPEHNSTGFCHDMSHECHENPASIADLEQARLNGEVSERDVDRIFHGTTV